MNDPTDHERVIGLTSREKEVLEQVAMGSSAKEVARDLSLGSRTVEKHIDNIRLKLHARNKPHLITRAFQIGALKLP